MVRIGARSEGLVLWAGVSFGVWLTACSASPPELAVELPARFEASRIFVDVAVRGGDTLHLYTDTGGGIFIYGHAADRVDWNDSAGVRLREIVLDKYFPEPLGAPDHQIPIFRPDDHPDLAFGDGILGQAWFADRIWTFDYPLHRLVMHAYATPLERGGETIQLGFRTDSAGARAISFPRMTVLVDGESLDMLFDTGATVRLAEEARQLLGRGAPAVQGTSFITSEVLSRWRARHPDWRVIPNADESVDGMAMILVPEVSIGGHAVGPVWFTERPDANFHEFMSRWMDRRVDGALGGNVFRFFRITVDYPSALARFARATGPD